MNHDSESLKNALDATSDFESEMEIEIYRFQDSRLRYELQLQPNSGTALLAMDPTEPIQGCPMLEFSFQCTSILLGTSSFCTEGDGRAIRFYEGDVSPAAQRLTMTWVPEGYWYVWANANTKPYPEPSE